MAIYKSNVRFRTDREMLIHKVQFLHSQHWRDEEIANELHISTNEVRAILLGDSIEYILCGE